MRVAACGLLIALAAGCGQSAGPGDAGVQDAGDAGLDGGNRDGGVGDGGNPDGGNPDAAGDGSVVLARDIPGGTPLLATEAGVLYGPRGGLALLPLDGGRASFFSGNYPLGLAFDGERVYWSCDECVRVDDIKGVYVSGLKSALLDGGSEQVLITDAGRGPGGVAVAGGSAWVHSGFEPGAFFRASLDGGPSAVVDPDAQADGLAERWVGADETGVYYITSFDVRRVRLDGGWPASVAGSNPTALAVFGGFVYWIDDANSHPEGSASGVLSRTPNDRFHPTVLANGIGGFPALAVDETGAYVFASSRLEVDGGAQLIAVPLDGGSARVLATSRAVNPYFSNESGIALDKNAVYWVDRPDGDFAFSVLMRTPK